jgi:c-di-GMP-related signal transduction protein
MDTSHNTVFLGRQPILNRNQEIMGYELLFRSADTLHANIGDFRYADSFVISNVLSNFGINEVIGKHKGFVNVTEELLLSDALELLPVTKTVIEILETVRVTEQVLDRCRELKARGFALALDDNVYHPDYEPLYQLVDIVKIDILQLSDHDLREMVKLLACRGLTLLAEKVETYEQYRACLDMGFDLFQGYYFAKPTVINKKKVDVAGLTLLKLLTLVCRDANIDEIEDTFKHNPNLSYNLLRLVNSVVIGMKEKIGTLRHALVVLGMKQLQRWIQLALYASDRSGKSASPLLETAAARGRLMELLVLKHRETYPQRDYSDSAFMTGVLSLVDVLLGLPMAEIVGQLNLTEDVRAALLQREGSLGKLLLLIEQLESMELTNVLSLLEQQNVSLDVLFASQMEAINWTNSLDEIL